jgi:hypothetical protein
VYYSSLPVFGVTVHACLASVVSVHTFHLHLAFYLSGCLVLAADSSQQEFASLQGVLWMALWLRRTLVSAFLPLRNPLFKPFTRVVEPPCRKLHCSRVIMAASGDAPTIFDKILAKEVRGKQML